MPPTGDPPTTDGDRTKDSDRGDRQDKFKTKSSNANTKSKDLSHVPCKFFKVGGCTAGPSCPFSHTLSEPGQKEHCAWFVKGNCKFGHKCALAHVLPGQDLSMDRKNKKAAQQAAAAAGGGGERKDRGAKGANKRDAGADRGHGPKNALLAGGSTAPRSSASSRPPPMSMPLKAAISPSAPAPPLKDTDFSSFASLDEMEGVQDDDEGDNQASKEDKGKSSNSNDGAPVPLPLSAPRSATSAGPNEYGPIGSPPTAKSPPHLNGFGNGASPSNEPNTILSSSPFSAPGTQTSFYPSSYSRGIPASLGSGLAMRKAWGDVYDASSPSKYSSNRHATTAVVDEEMEDFIPGSLTDLLTPEERSRRMSRSNSGQPPVGLTAAANALKITSTNDGGGPDSTGAGGAGGIGMGHRHSRSVPAPSLLGDLKSIWSDTPAGLPASPGHRGTPSTPSALAARFENLNVNSNNNNNGGGADDSGNLSMSFGSPSNLSMLSPSNASAAFLPGFHSQYLAAKAKQQQQPQPGGLARGMRNTSNPLYPTHSNPSPNPSSTNNNNNGNSTNSLATNYLHPSSAGLPSSIQSNSTLHTHVHGGTAHTYRTTPSPFDLTQNLNLRPRGVSGLVSSSVSIGGGLHGALGGGGGLGAAGGIASAGLVGGAGGGLGGLNEQDDDHLLRQPHVLSPSTRALQSHAPGQSLPQGLAAGLSRIHALPPVGPSPGASGLSLSGTPGSYLGGAGGGGGSVGTNHLHHLGPYGDWQSNAAAAQAALSSSHTHSQHSHSHYMNKTAQAHQYGVPAGHGFGAPPGLPEVNPPLSSTTGVGVGAGGSTSATTGASLSGSGASGKPSYSAVAAAPSAPPGIAIGARRVQQPQYDEEDLFSMDG
ncbi:hypothetical protein MD484_g300, partial [Candolleomyces efflorescens]